MKKHALVAFLAACSGVGNEAIDGRISHDAGLVRDARVPTSDALTEVVDATVEGYDSNTEDFDAVLPKIDAQEALPDAPAMVDSAPPPDGVLAPDAQASALDAQLFHDAKVAVHDARVVVVHDAPVAYDARIDAPIIMESDASIPDALIDAAFADEVTDPQLIAVLDQLPAQEYDVNKVQLPNGTLIGDNISNAKPQVIEHNHNSFIMSMVLMSKDLMNRGLWPQAGQPNPEDQNGLAYSWGSRDPRRLQAPPGEPPAICTTAVYGLDCSGMLALESSAAGLNSWSILQGTRALADVSNWNAKFDEKGWNIKAVEYTGPDLKTGDILYWESKGHIGLVSYVPENGKYYLNQSNGRGPEPDEGCTGTCEADCANNLGLTRGPNAKRILPSGALYDEILDRVVYPPPTRRVRFVEKNPSPDAAAPDAPVQIADAGMPDASNACTQDCGDGCCYDGTCHQGIYSNVCGGNGGVCEVCQDQWPANPSGPVCSVVTRTCGPCRPEFFQDLPNGCPNNPGYKNFGVWNNCCALPGSSYHCYDPNREIPCQGRCNGRLMAFFCRVGDTCDPEPKYMGDNCPYRCTSPTGISDTGIEPRADLCGSGYPVNP